MKRLQIGKVSSNMTIGEFLQFKEDSEFRVMELLNEINDKFKEYQVHMLNVEVGVYSENNFDNTDSSIVHEVKFTLDI